MRLCKRYLISVAKETQFTTDVKACNVDLLSAILFNNPTIYYCTETNIKWDKGWTLTAKDHCGYIKSPQRYFSCCQHRVQGIFQRSSLPLRVVSQRFCQFVVLPDQYSYDCNNVSSGPNAAREGNRKYHDT